MTEKTPDVRTWMVLTKYDGAVLGEAGTPWRPWEPQEGVLPSPAESMRDVAFEALVRLSEQSAERGYAPLSSRAALYVEDLLLGRVLTLDDGTSVWLAKAEGAADIPGIGRCAMVSFTKGHIIVRRNPGRGSKQAFPYARLAPVQGS